MPIFGMRSCGASLSKASLTGARLFGADLRGASGIEGAIVDWIDVGEETPQLLTPGASRAWLSAGDHGGHDIAHATMTASRARL